jgi:hypothetical protein
MSANEYDIPDALQRLLDESEIRALSATYARGLDRQDQALVRCVFADDATTHYGTFTGGPNEMSSMAMRALGEHTDTQHLLGQINISFEVAEPDGVGDTKPARASGEVYFQAYHRAPIDGVARDRFICGRYVDRYAKRNGAWLMTHRTEVVDWTRTEDVTDDYFTKRPATVRGSRDNSDLSYRPEEA